MTDLIARGPFGLLNELQRDMNRLFDSRLLPTNHELLGDPDRWVPAVDIAEDDKAYHLTVDVPGIPARDIEITAHDGVLSIRGQREAVHKDKETHRVERAVGAFLREFRMPQDADLEQVEARNADGVLTVVVQKVARPEPRRVEVK